MLTGPGLIDAHLYETAAAGYLGSLALGGLLLWHGFFFEALGLR